MSAHKIPENTKHDTVKCVEKIFVSRRDEIVRLLSDMYFSSAFDNVHTLNPRRLARYGNEEYQHIVSYLSSPNNETVREIGANRAAEGLGIRSVMKSSAFWTQLCLEGIEREECQSLREVIAAVSDYNASYIEGFVEEQKRKTIQQQKEMRQALSTALGEQREALFIRNYSIRSSINAILLANLEGHVTYVNPSFINMWNYRDLAEVLKIGNIADVAGEGVEAVIRSLADTESWRGELELKRRDGAKFDVEMSASQIIDDNDNLLGTVASFVDVTERKRIEQQFRVSQKMNALGQLAAGITHDFNNMFSVTKGYLQLILKEVKEDSRLYDDVRQIKVAVDRCAGLTKQLQYFARGVVGERNPLNINIIIKETYDLLRHAFPPGIEIVLLPDDEIWTLEADASQLSHVIINFCVNARDAIMEKLNTKSAGDGKEPERGVITIKTRNVHFDRASASRYLGAAPGKYVHLSISDNGIGMSKEILDRVFEPFYTTKRNQKNTGLGLSIIYGIIENLKGHIDVLSRPGQGTTFNVFLPASEESVMEWEKERARPPILGSEKTILIVDDELQLLEITSRFLKQYGYQVLAAQNGSEALKIYRKSKDQISLVLLDVVMPEMRGEVCFREIRALNPNAKVLLMTGFTNDDSSYHAVRNEAVGLIEKPFDLYQMLEMIKSLLQA